MDEALKQALRQALGEVPQFAESDLDALKIERQGGLTNLVYRVDDGDERYILRLPGEGTNSYIDRKVELHNARAAAKAGVSAQVLYGNEATGLMLSRFVDGIVTMTPEEFGKRDGAPARAALALKQMHQSGEAFQFRFELFSMIDDYLGHLDKLGAQLPDGYHEVVSEAEIIRGVLDRNPVDLAPCHCDPLCENFLDDGTRMWIVDWEYSGMNDPYWDLGDLSVEAGFTPAQDQELMEAYCDGPPTAAAMGRMIIYKASCDLLWTLWGLLQHANNNPAEDFWAYALGRFDRCRTLLATDEFKSALKEVDLN